MVSEYTKSLDMQDRIIFALDDTSEFKCEYWCKRLEGHVGLVKIGSQIFNSIGPKAIEIAADYGHEVMLDLKLHDIPNTVNSSINSIVEEFKHNIMFITVHASGGQDMLRSALAGAGSRSQVLAVTTLTSLNDYDAERIYGYDAAITVLRLADMAYKAGIRGFVCSPNEIISLRHRYGDDITLVTPGVRPEGAVKNDQVRVATPKQAIYRGADYLVIGRPIKDADDPIATIDAIAASMQ